MKGFKEFLDELMHADSVTEVLMENRKETVKLAAIIVLILMGILLYMHQGSAQLQISDAAGDSGTGTEQSIEGEADSDAEGSSLNAGAKAGPSYDTDGIVYVDIGGAVKQPMLAELPSGSRVEDAIQAAGGLKKNADLSAVNRAQILTDGEKVYIPAKGEESAAGDASGGSSESGNASGSGGSSAQGMVGISSGRININTADVTLLQQLTGVGPVTAQKIVDYREQNGKFKSIEDIKNVSGIGDKTFEKMKDDITV